jgi:hypothetical protein
MENPFEPPKSPIRMIPMVCAFIEICVTIAAVLFVTFVVFIEYLRYFGAR